MIRPVFQALRFEVTEGSWTLGMSEGAAMAFLVSGGVVSIWGRRPLRRFLNSSHFCCISPWLFWARWQRGMYLSGQFSGLFLSRAAICAPAENCKRVRVL